MARTDRQYSTEDRWLSQQEAARYLGVEVSTLAKWRSLGQGPAYSCALKRDPRYRLSILDDFMEAAVATNTTEARTRRREQSCLRLV